MAIEWSKMYENQDESAAWFASLGFFTASIIYPGDGGYRLSVEYDNRGNGDNSVYETLQEAQDAAVPMALAMVDGWRAELLELVGYKDLVARVEIQCEHVHESLGRCVREWGHTEGEHRYGAK